MGMLIDGNWEPDDVSTTDQSGRWQRAPSTFRHWVSDAADAKFPAAAGRYHLYVAWNCPWAHRALLARCMKGLIDAIDISIAAPKRTSDGWVFDPAAGYCDQLFKSLSLHEIYTRSDPGFTGRVTVPVLWDTVSEQIVSNESADIVRMFGTVFENFATKPFDLYPEDKRDAIDSWNSEIHTKLNNGVYRAGFASQQSAYDEAVSDVFATLDTIEDTLSKQAYLTGDEPTEADWRLFPTLVRFDVGYYSAFKCNLRRISDYPNLWRYARTLYAYPGIAETVKFDIYRSGYHSQNPKRNPFGVIPAAPQINWAL